MVLQQGCFCQKHRDLRTNRIVLFARLEWFCSRVVFVKEHCDLRKNRIILCENRMVL